tara:strand:+ start:6262 stop:6495 length:234 start_codon:yes stop_codon:yes gene_type:complete
MWKSKTVWAALTSLLGAAAAVATEEASLAEGLHIAVTAILAIFLRHGVAKTQDTAEAAVEAASSVTPAPKKKAAKKA